MSSEHQAGLFLLLAGPEFVWLHFYTSKLTTFVVTAVVPGHGRGGARTVAASDRGCDHGPSRTLDRPRL